VAGAAYFLVGWNQSWSVGCLVGVVELGKAESTAVSAEKFKTRPTRFLAKEREVTLTLTMSLRINAWTHHQGHVPRYRVLVQTGNEKRNFSDLLSRQLEGNR